MQKFAKLVMLFALTALLVAPLAADDKEKKGKRKGKGRNQVGAQLMKKLEKVDLKEEQTAKIKAIVAKYGEKIVAARKEISPDIRKKQAAAAKKARAEGKKGKELQAAVTAALGLSDEEAKGYKEATAKLAGLTREMNKEVAGVLTEEQRKAAKIRVGKAKGKSKKKNKKKKDDA